MEMQLIKKCLAEVLGTLTLTLFGCGTVALAGESVGDLGVALAFGLSIVCMYYAIGSVSGCHLNPAVTLAVRLNKGMSTPEMMAYWFSQFFGAFIGAALLLFIEFSCGISAVIEGLGCNSFGIDSPLGINMNGAVIVEILLTCVFVMTFLGVTTHKKTKPIAGIVIGLSLAFVHILGINLTGTSVNPARSFGPALMMCIAGDIAPLTQVWVFLISPLIGGALGTVLYRVITSAKQKEY